jgi:hypothetical protein
MFVGRESSFESDGISITLRFLRDVGSLKRGNCLLNPSHSYLQNLRNGQNTPFSLKILDQNVAQNNQNRNAHLHDIRLAKAGLREHLSSDELEELKNEGYAIKLK